MSFELNDLDKESRPKTHLEELEHYKFLKTELDKVAVRIGNDKATPLYTYRAFSDINYTDLLQFANNAGFLEGEAYDLIEYGIGPNDNPIATFTLDDLSQFQLVFKINAVDNFSIQKRPAEFFLLTEQGDMVIAENGDNIKIQGLVP